MNNKKNTKEWLTFPTCQICHKNKINRLFQPCMHFICCQECSKKIRICYQCNKNIDRKVRIYC